MKVHELMNEAVVTVTPTTLLKEVATILTDRGISGVPVVGTDQRVVGVVSEADIVAREQGPAPRRRVLPSLALSEPDPDDGLPTAGEAMTSPAITVNAGADVSYAARRLTEYNVKRLPVVNVDGQLIGIVTRSDLVRAFARRDTDVAHEIRQEMRTELWLAEPDRVNVQVEGGRVQLSGAVDRRSDAELLRLFAARVPGVVAVQSEVSWDLDDRSARF